MIERGDDLTERIKEITNGDNIFVITDSNVARLYPQLIAGTKNYIIDPGEMSKNLAVLSVITESLIEAGGDRKTKIIALGGGVVGDLAGFVAAVFMRGVPWISIPTTLLAQVDSGIGGKTAVNFEGYKNLLGVFHAPQAVLISAHFLDTLPLREKNCGLGEIIKTAFLSRPLKKLVDESLTKLIAFDKETVSNAVGLCVEFKKHIVELDEKETNGIRKCLNLGHTIGHALEKEDNFNLSHGEYVLWGLWYETFLTKNFISMEQYLYMTAVLRKVLKGRYLEFDSILVSRAAMSDKKNSGGRISIIAATDMDNRKELFFSQNEVYEGLELCKRTSRL